MKIIKIIDLYEVFDIFTAMLPENFLLTDRITITIDAEKYQYRVTYSIFGELLKVELPFLKLPPNAQRLTKGKDTEKYLVDLENQKKLLRYKIPLAILGFWKRNEFNEISTSIANRESELGTELPDDFLPLVTDPWLRDFYLKIKEDITKKGTGDFWRGLAGLMSNDSVKLEESFRYLRSYSWQLPAEIIGDLWPTISDRSVLRHFYQHVHLYPSEKTQNWLLKELPKERATFFRGLMIKGLTPFQNPTVYKTLLNHYHTQREMGEGEAEILISSLSEYDTEEVRAIAWKALIGANYFAAKAAHQVLNKHGVGEKMIAQKLTTVFLDDQYSDRVNSLLSRFQNLQDTELLLTSQTFMMRSIYAVKHHKNVRLQTNLSSLLDRTWTRKTMEMVIECLYHPEPFVRRLGLDQISGLSIQFPKRFQQCNPDTLKRIFQLTGDTTEAVSVEALETIRVLVPRFGQPSWIANLLKIQNRNQLLNHLLPAILALHRKGFSELSVVPFSMKNLSHKSNNIKRYSILILQYYRIPEVIDVLKKVRESDPTIQEALGRGWRDDDDLVKVLR